MSLGFVITWHPAYEKSGIMFPSWPQHNDKLLFCHMLCNKVNQYLDLHLCETEIWKILQDKSKYVKTKHEEDHSQNLYMIAIDPDIFQQVLGMPS